MSDPVQSVEIEDVLSSIRRLVSEEPTPRAAVSQTFGTEDAVPRTPEKLLLTPAFRVLDPGPDAEDIDGDDSASQTDEAAQDGEEADEANAPRAEESPDVSDEGGAESVEDEPEVLILPEEAAALELEDALIEDTAAPELEPEIEVDVWEEVSLEERVAELEVAVAASGGDWEVEDEDISPGDVVLEAQAPETAADEVLSEAEEEALFDAVQNEDAEAVLDEEALRELISDIVRQELQGTLGERITRNVRKLVRHEINRALASRDFE